MTQINADFTSVRQHGIGCPESEDVKPDRIRIGTESDAKALSLFVPEEHPHRSAPVSDGSGFIAQLDAVNVGGAGEESVQSFAQTWANENQICRIGGRDQIVANGCRALPQESASLFFVGNEENHQRNETHCNKWSNYLLFVHVAALWQTLLRPSMALKPSVACEGYSE